MYNVGDIYYFNEYSIIKIVKIIRNTQYNNVQICVCDVLYYSDWNEQIYGYGYHSKLLRDWRLFPKYDKKLFY